MLTLEHKETKAIYYITSTFPNKRGEITLYIRGKGMHTLPKLCVGTTVYEYVREMYPMLRIIEDTNLDRD